MHLGPTDLVPLVGTTPGRVDARGLIEGTGDKCVVVLIPSEVSHLAEVPFDSQLGRPEAILTARPLVHGPSIRVGKNCLVCH